jgi:hypothetical protein
VDSETVIELTNLRSEIGTLRVDLAVIAAEVVRLREALHSTNRGCIAILHALEVLKNQNVAIQTQVTILESWAGVPDVTS